MSYKYIHKCLRLSNARINNIVSHPIFDGAELITFRKIKPNFGSSILKNDIRKIHSTYSLLIKEMIGTDTRHAKNGVPDIYASTSIEKLKESVQTNQNMKANHDKKPSTVPFENDGETRQQDEEPEEKLTIMQKVRNGIVHTYHGFRLFFLELKVGFGLLITLTKGNSLTRRERKQLVRTFADLARIIPFLVFIIVPFMELLLPFYIKFFPFMMPSTFQDDPKKADKTDKTRQILKGKLEIAKFLQETLAESSGAQNDPIDGKVNIRTFSTFLKQVRESGLTANTEDILRYSQLFEDEVTLESLDRTTLKALCKMLELNVMGPPSLLRFQLRMKVRHLKVDDQLIASEGIDKIPVWELQQLCRERGMRSIGVSEERLRYQLSQWLSLHLENKVPITLLLLTRVIYLPETLTPEEKLKQAIKVLPDSVSNEAKLKVVTTDKEMDKKTKFEVIKEEQKIIKQERKEANIVAKIIVEEAKVEPAEKLKETEDKAPIITTSPEQTDIAAKIEMSKIMADTAPVINTDDAAKDTAPKVKPDISIHDLSQIESAIVKLKETKEIFTKEELDDLKESRDLTTKKTQEVEPQVPIEKSKNLATDRIAAKVDKMIIEMDTMFEDLHKEKAGTVHKKAETAHEKVAEAIKSEQERFINIVDLKTILRQIDKLPDDEKWQHILSVLDEDGDGMIEMDHIMKMIQLLGTETVKLTESEVSKLLSMLDKEAIVAESKKSNKPSGQ